MGADYIREGCMTRALVLVVTALLGIVASTQFFVIKTQRTVMDRLNYAEDFDKAVAQRMIGYEGMISGNAKNIELITKYLVRFHNQQD